MSKRPLILLIFANDRQAYLEAVTKERQQLIKLLRFEIEKNALDIEVDSLDYTTIGSMIEMLNLQRERLAILHFAGHSDTDLLQLDEGQAHVNGLAAKLGECPNLKLVFLNGCNNAALVRAIAAVGVASIIGTRRAVADTAALHFSSGFFTALAAQGRTLSEAWNQAKTDVETVTGEQSRSLDIEQPDNTQEWSWFMVSQTPDWKLVDATHPCNRLPALPHGELPATPFKNLDYYTEADAEIFFGRCQPMLDVIHLLDVAKEPVLLLHGGTGVGKSSFLQAGLIPRLKARGQIVPAPFRYSQSDSMQNPVERIFGITDITEIRTRLNKPSPSGLPSVWVIDQVEEIFFDQTSNHLDELLKALHAIFYLEDARPAAKIILSLRKEWFADLLDACQLHKINTSRCLLTSLDKLSIMEIIESPTQNMRLRKHYHLKILNPDHGRLAEQIADDLLVDKESNIAPTLQIILSYLWERVKHKDDKVWDEQLYQDENRTGLLLVDYLDRQLQDIADHEPWGKEAKASGLLLDVLHAHTTNQGTAKTITAEEYGRLYSHVNYCFLLLHGLKDRHLIIEPQTGALASVVKTRLAHDTLAQLVRQSFDVSVLPGQQARRILNNRKNEWRLEGNQKAPLVGHDLKIVKMGKNGTQNWEVDKLEKEIIEKSSQKKIIRIIKNTLITTTLLLALSILIFFTLNLGRYSAANKIDELHKNHLYLSSEHSDRPTTGYFGKINKISDEISSISDDVLSKKNKIIKYSTLTSINLSGANFSEKSNNQQSLNYAKKALEFGVVAEEMIKNYGIDSEFIKGKSQDGDKNRHDTILFMMIHANAIMYCNGDEGSLLQANYLLEKISPVFFDSKRSSNDLCLNEILQSTTKE